MKDVVDFAGQSRVVSLPIELYLGALSASSRNQASQLESLTS